MAAAVRVRTGRRGRDTLGDTRVVVVVAEPFVHQRAVRGRTERQHQRRQPKRNHAPPQKGGTVQRLGATFRHGADLNETNLAKLSIGRGQSLATRPDAPIQRRPPALVQRRSVVKRDSHANFGPAPSVCDLKRAAPSLPRIVVEHESGRPAGNGGSRRRRSGDRCPSSTHGAWPARDHQRRKPPRSVSITDAPAPKTPAPPPVRVTPPSAPRCNHCGAPPQAPLRRFPSTSSANTSRKTACS